MYSGLPFDMYASFFFERHAEGGLTEVQRYCVIAMLRNGDEKSALDRLRDWGRLRGEPPAQPERTCEISKFVPGDHFYVLGEKFNSQREAERHAKTRGFKVAGVTEKHAPTDENPLLPETGWSVYD